MRRVSAAVVTTLLATLAVVASAPLSSSAATTVNYTAEVSGVSVAARATAQGWATTWRAAAVAAGGTPSSYITFNQPTFMSTPTASLVTGTIYTAVDGTTVSVQRTKYSYPGSPTLIGPSTLQGFVTCTGSGGSLQGGAPRPTDLVDSAGCPTTIVGSRGFAYDALGGTGENTTRDAVEFTFSKPVLAFGAWFGDLETRTVAGGLPAIVRLYGATGPPIAEQQVVPSTPDQTLCGDTFTGCGNNQTRWIDFVADPNQPVSRMVIIVGDDDPMVDPNQMREGLGLIGAMVATMPQLTATKVLASGYPINLGTGQYEVKYDLSLTNTGGSALTAVGLVEDLAATFAPLSAASISVQSVSVTGTVAVNPSFNGTTVTQLLNTAASTLAVGATFTASVTVRVTPGSALGPFNNLVTASGTAGTTTVSDTNDLPVPVTFTESPGLTAIKAVTSVTSNGDGSQSVGFSVVVTNTGNVVLRDLTVSDPLATAFASQFLSTTVPVVSGVGPGSSITANPSFNGGVNPQLIALPSSLAAGGSFTITFTARIVATSPAPGVNAITASATSPAGAPVTAAGTAPVNLPFTGSLRINKVVTGTPLTANSTFPFAVNCGAAGSFAASVTIGPGDSSGSTTIPNIPALASCTVTEGVLPPPPAGFFWSGTTVSPGVSSIVDGAVTTATVTNRLTQNLGTLRIQLDVSDGPSSGITGNFVFQADCGSSGTFPAILSFAGTRSATASVPNIPVPTTCVITETSRPPTPAGFAWSTLSIPPITTAVTTTPITVTAITALVPRSVIAATGNDPTGIIVVVLVMLVLGSAFLVIARVKRRRRIDRS